MTAMAGEVSGASTVGTRPLLFISHRHDDKALADVIGGFIRSRSAGQVDVYQSSDANAVGPKAGAQLTDELREALWRAARVIFLYTRVEADWGWCLFESGLALQPDTPPTRLTVFSCGGTAPPQLSDRVHVKIRDRSDIQRFTNHFLTDKDFFPGLDRAIAGFAENDPDVIAASDSFYGALQEIPDPQDQRVEDWPAYPFLQLEIGCDDSERLCAEGARADRLDVARDVVRQARVSDSDSEGARIFNRRWQEGDTATFGEYVKAWCEHYDDAAPDWLDALCDQLLDGARWQWPSLRWVLMRSIDRKDGALYGPALTRVRRWPDRRMQFDVEFQPFELAPDGAVEIKLPG
jgi:TIR domain